MSSLVDAVLRSEQSIPDPESDMLLSSRLESEGNAPTPRPSGERASSVRPRQGGPAPSTPAHHTDDDMNIDPEDQVVGPKGTVPGSRARQVIDPTIPKEVDRVAEKLQDVFEGFIEGYVAQTWSGCC